MKGDLLVVLLRQCWLKRQKDPLSPEFHDSGISNPWTSGLVFNKDVVCHALLYFISSEKHHRKKYTEHFRSVNMCPLFALSISELEIVLEVEVAVDC
jgi:hypothetical protein